MCRLRLGTFGTLVPISILETTTIPYCRDHERGELVSIAHGFLLWRGGIDAIPAIGLDHPLP